MSTPRQAWAHHTGRLALLPLGTARAPGSATAGGVDDAVPATVVPRWDAAAVGDRLRIAETFHVFGIAHDEARADVVASCFAADGVLEVVEGGAPIAVFDGRATIERRIGAIVAEQADQRRHVMGNVVVDSLGEDTGSAMAYGVVTVADGDGLRLGAAVLYTADLVREPDGAWRFTRLLIGMDLYTGTKPASGSDTGP